MNIRNLGSARKIFEETGIVLKKCPFCGDVGDLEILNMSELFGFNCSYNCNKMKMEISELHHTWAVCCPSCGCLGGDTWVSTEDHAKKLKANGFYDTNPKTDEEAIIQAIEKWNVRAG